VARERKVGGCNSCGRKGSTVQLWTRDGQDWWGKLCGKHLKEMLERGWLDKKPIVQQASLVAQQASLAVHKATSRLFSVEAILSDPSKTGQADPKSYGVAAAIDNIHAAIKHLQDALNELEKAK
jgi:hypothetical protein